MVGLTTDQIRDSRLGNAVDAKTDTLLHFVRKVVETRGRVGNDDLDEVRAAGFDDGVIAEVVAHVALNAFTNYFNELNETDLDFPKAPELQVSQQVEVE
jgi:alkylhydroperoxidase family enzyme